jgi:hypothetical protein
MIETTIFVIGVIVGVCVVLGIQWVYNWIASMCRQVESVKWDLERLTRQREDWTEFMFWKNNHQSKE